MTWLVDGSSKQRSRCRPLRFIQCQIIGQAWWGSHQFVFWDGLSDSIGRSADGHSCQTIPQQYLRLHKRASSRRSISRICCDRVSCSLVDYSLWCHPSQVADRRSRASTELSLGLKLPSATLSWQRSQCNPQHRLEWLELSRISRRSAHGTRAPPCGATASGSDQVRSNLACMRHFVGVPWLYFHFDYPSSQKWCFASSRSTWFWTWRLDLRGSRLVHRRRSYFPRAALSGTQSTLHTHVGKPQLQAAFAA